MGNSLKKTYIWWIIYILAECLLVYIFKYKVNEKFLYLGIIGGIYLLVNLFLLKSKQERFFVNGIILLVSVTLIGILIGNYLSLLTIFCMGVAVSIVDILSFTKYGKKTTNAKVMSNPNMLYKLLIYGKGKGDMLYPIYGLGDCFFYALWISGLSKSIEEMLLLGLAVLVGSLVNMLIVQRIHMKQNYKGLPGTPIPFICVTVCYMLI